MAEKFTRASDASSGDGWQVEQLLDAEAAPTAPDGAVSELLEALRQPGTDRELVGESAMVQLFKDTVGASTAGGQPVRRRSGRRRTIPPLAIAGAVTLVVFGGTAAAAAKGALPTAAQDFAHRTLGAPAHAPDSVDPERIPTAGTPGPPPSVADTAATTVRPTGPAPSLRSLCLQLTRGSLPPGAAGYLTLTSTVGPGASVTSYCEELVGLGAAAPTPGRSSDAPRPEQATTAPGRSAGKGGKGSSATSPGEGAKGRPDVIPRATPDPRSDKPLGAPATDPDHPGVGAAAHSNKPTDKGGAPQD